MNTLLDDNPTIDDSEDYAVEAVLSLDDVTVEIDQFDTSGAGEGEEFAFIASSGPTLSEVQDYTKPEEVELSPEDAPKSHVDFVLPDSNPLDEVAEPVHTGQGSVFLNADNSDDDFTGSVGPTSQSVVDPQVTTEESTDDSSENRSNINFTTDTPELPDIFDSSTQLKEDNTERIESTPELPDIPAEMPPQSSDDTPDLPDIPSEATTIFYEAKIAEAPKHQNHKPMEEYGRGLLNNPGMNE